MSECSRLRDDLDAPPRARDGHVTYLTELADAHVVYLRDLGSYLEPLCT